MTTNTTVTRLGKGVVIRGAIRGDGDLEVEGRVEGSIEVSGDVAIERSGRVQAPVSGENVIVRGAVAGAVRATESVVLEDGARVVGDLNAPSIGIRPGGLLRGYVSTTGKAGSVAAGGSAGAGKPRGASSRSAERPVATPAPRAQRPATLARTREEAAPAAPVTAPTAVGRLPPPRTPPPRVPAPAPSRPAFVEPTGSPLTRASGRTSGGPPPPVVPSLKKGAKGAMKKKGAR